MWKCDKCGREFKKINQSHFCDGLGDTVDSYIEQSEHHEVLSLIRKVINDVEPEVDEKLSCKIPTFIKGKNKIQFAVNKNHLGFYPGDEAVNEFANRITESGYTYNKGCIQIPWDKPIDYKLIEEIVKYKIL